MTDDSRQTGGDLPPPRTHDFEGQTYHLFPTAELMDPGLRPMYDFWRTRCGARLPVLRRQLDPLEMPVGVLPWMFMARVLDGGENYEYSLVGTGMVEMLGRDMTGRRFAAIDYPDDHRRYLLHRFQTVLRETAPMVSTGRATWVKREHIPIATLLLPGSSDGARTDYIFGVTVERQANRIHDL